MVLWVEFWCDLLGVVCPPRREASSRVGVERPTTFLRSTPYLFLLLLDNFLDTCYNRGAESYRKGNPVSQTNHEQPNANHSNDLTPEAIQGATYTTLRRMYERHLGGSTFGVSANELRDALLAAIEAQPEPEPEVQPVITGAPNRIIERESAATQRDRYTRMKEYAARLSRRGTYPRLSDEALGIGFLPYHEGIATFKEVGGDYAKSGRCSVMYCEYREITEEERDADLVSNVGPFKGWAAYTLRKRAYCLPHLLQKARKLGLRHPFADDADNVAFGFDARSQGHQLE